MKFVKAGSTLLPWKPLQEGNSKISMPMETSMMKTPEKLLLQLKDVDQSHGVVHVNDQVLVPG